MSPRASGYSSQSSRGARARVVDIDVIEHLAQEIGVRFAGTPAELEAARFIEGQFRALGLETSLECFQFLGWELLDPPELSITAPFVAPVPCFALVYAPGTPPAGLDLPVRRIGRTALLKGLECNKHALIDPKTGVQRAHIITRLQGPGAAMTLLEPARAVPAVLVGGEEAQALERWVDDYPVLRARLTLRATLRPDAMSCNVLATRPGRDLNSVVLVAAHHDTQYNSPGAVDNASGVQVALEVARRLSGVRLPRTVQFATFGAEEYMMLGSKHHVQALEETGRLGTIEAVINLDMPACNAPTRVNVTQDGMHLKARVARAFERFGLFDRFGRVDWQTPPWPTSDHAPFVEAGIPAVYISHRGLRYPHLHLPGDTLGKVDREVLRLNVDVVHALVLDLAGSD